MRDHNNESHNIGQQSSFLASDVIDVNDEKTILEQWKRMLDYAENTSERRIKVNNVYLAINTLLLGGCTFMSGFQNTLLSICGAFISILWFVSIITYRTSNKIRYEVIRDMETKMRHCPITKEYHKSENKTLYYGNTTIEALIPIVFIVLYVLCVLYSPSASVA